MNPGEGLTEQYVVLPDGRRLRTVLAGEGPGPLVVFEAGMSAPAASWVHTQREISAHSRTLAYDRAGYGGSDVDPQDRTLERLADDLTALLDTLSETAPVVLVGHSWGGPIIREFADRYPERVAGLVFVDASLAEVMPDKPAKMKRAFQLLALVAQLGGKSLVLRATIQHPFSPEISKEDTAIVLRDYACAQAMRAGAREAEQLEPALVTMRRLQATGTPDVPTVSLQAGRVDRGMTTLRPLFNQTAADLMAAVPNGKTIVVENAGHLLPQEDPAAVRDAILALVAQTSKG